ncbi:MAG TPA: sigma-E factor negative regulatory protein [Gammaproteobacteria bacterium]|nr:sigma-E factor negative regulatory protein [Gammaproteobacteria bacterium]
MTDKINDQISAFIDDELSEQECAFLVRRFEHDSEARGQAVRYTLIGSALRNELLKPDPAILLRRISSALDGAAAPVVPARTARSWSPRIARPLAGLAIAAGVASIAILGLRALNDTSVPASAPVAATQAAADVVEPASYVVPRDVAEERPVTPTIRLTNYVVHHGEYASGLNRTSVHSNVVTAPEILLDEQERAEPEAAPVVLE